MIGELLDNLVAALVTHLGTGNLMEGIAAVQVGDEMPRETADHPLVTVDFVRDASTPDGFQPSLPLRVNLDLMASLYVCSLPKGNTPARTALDLYWRVESGVQKGLKVALRAITVVQAAGAKFVVKVGETRPKRRSQSPQGRWSYGLEVPLSASAHVART